MSPAEPTIPHTDEITSTEAKKLMSGMTDGKFGGNLHCILPRCRLTSLCSKGSFGGLQRNSFLSSDLAVRSVMLCWF